MPTPTETIPMVVPGDLDEDGAVTAADAKLLVGEIFDGGGEEAADVNGDGRVDAADLTALTLLRSD
jgi:hypothetical protein